jgi:hypothetical protein
MFAFVGDIATTLKISYKTAIERRKERELAAERKKVAAAFNNIYTYRFRYDTSSNQRVAGTGMYGFTPEAGYAWMCPDCNKVHLASSCSAMSGLQYPSCCNHREGHRLYYDIRTR